MRMLRALLLAPILALATNSLLIEFLAGVWIAWATARRGVAAPARLGDAGSGRRRLSRGAGLGL